MTKSRVILRRFAGDTARAVLSDAGFGPGREVFVLTSGQFSSVDFIDALIDYCGPCDLVIATWTAAHADLKRVKIWLESRRVLTSRWLVDRSFPSRQPDACEVIRAAFGDGAITLCNSHAKFALLSSGEWRIVVLTSANLNQNRRIENFWAADDPALFAEFERMVDEAFGARVGAEEQFDGSNWRAPNDALKAADAAVRDGKRSYKRAQDVKTK